MFLNHWLCYIIFLTTACIIHVFEPLVVLYNFWTPACIILYKLLILCISFSVPFEYILLFKILCKLWATEIVGTPSPVVPPPSLLFPFPCPNKLLGIFLKVLKNNRLKDACYTSILCSSSNNSRAPPILKKYINVHWLPHRQQWF